MKYIIIGDPNPKIEAATNKILKPPTSKPNLSASQAQTPRIFRSLIKLRFVNFPYILKIKNALPFFILKMISKL
jgi:hypothetical protein